LIAKKVKAKAKPVPEERNNGVRKPAADVLESLVSRGLGPLVERVAHEHGCAPLEVCGSSMQQPIPAARGKLWKALYEEYAWSLPRIGEVFDVDHSSVIYQLKKYEPKTGKPGKAKKVGT
jgi:chromosomal replication initiation ATPase DnaA